MRHISALFFIFLLVLLPSCKYFKDRGLFGKKQKALAELLAQQDSIRVADSIKIVQDRLMAIENAKLDSLRKADQERLAMESKYYIIVGSFLTPRLANGLAEVYRNKGYDAKVLTAENSRFELVAAEWFNDLSKAMNRLKELHDTDLIEAWIYIKKYDYRLSVIRS